VVRVFERGGGNDWVFAVVVVRVAFWIGIVVALVVVRAVRGSAAVAIFVLPVRLDIAIPAI
jgi:hypothetical protein